MRVLRDNTNIQTIVSSQKPYNGKNKGKLEYLTP